MSHGPFWAESSWHTNYTKCLWQTRQDNKSSRVCCELQVCSKQHETITSLNTCTGVAAGRLVSCCLISTAA